MSQAYKEAIESLLMDISAKEAEIAAKLAEVAPLKLAANTLAKIVGLTEPFADVNVPVSLVGPHTSAVKWPEAHFYNRQLTDCVVEILDARKTADGKGRPASVDEIYEALKSGNYRFGGSGSEENSKRAVKISLTKNTSHFSKIGDDSFGLKRWYGPMKSGGKKSNGKGSDSTDSQTEIELEIEPEPEPEIEDKDDTTSNTTMEES